MPNKIIVKLNKIQKNFIKKWWNKKFQNLNLLNLKLMDQEHLKLKTLQIIKKINKNQNWKKIK